MNVSKGGVSFGDEEGSTGKGFVVLEEFAEIQDPEVGRRQGTLALPFY